MNDMHESNKGSDHPTVKWARDELESQPFRVQLFAILLEQFDKGTRFFSSGMMENWYKDAGLTLPPGLNTKLGEEAERPDHLIKKVIPKNKSEIFEKFEILEEALKDLVPIFLGEFVAMEKRRPRRRRISPEELPFLVDPDHKITLLE